MLEIGNHFFIQLKVDLRNEGRNCTNAHHWEESALFNHAYNMQRRAYSSLWKVKRWWWWAMGSLAPRRQHHIIKVNISRNQSWGKCRQADFLQSYFRNFLTFDLNIKCDASHSGLKIMNECHMDINWLNWFQRVVFYFSESVRTLGQRLAKKREERERMTTPQQCLFILLGCLLLGSILASPYISGRV